VQSAEEFLHGLDKLKRGRVISVLRSAGGMTRHALAKRAGVSPNTISDWEKGKIPNPRDLFAKLDTVLRFSVPKIRFALDLIRSYPQGSAEIAEAPAGPYDPAAIDESGSPDVRGMTSPEIAEEIAQLYSHLGRVESRIHLLNLEQAVRQGVLRPQG